MSNPSFDLKIHLIYLRLLCSYRKKQKDKLREIRLKRKQQQAELCASEEGKALLNDDRFNTLDSARFEKKFKKRPVKDGSEKKAPQKLSKTNASKTKTKSKLKSNTK